MTQKTFDCVDLQRKIRDKFVQEAEMNLDKFFELIEIKKKSSQVNKKLTNRLELENHVINAWYIIMKKKIFDCVEMKWKIHEEWWKEAGETFEGLIRLHDKLKETNDLYKFLIERKEKQMTTVWSNNEKKLYFVYHFLKEAYK